MRLLQLLKRCLCQNLMTSFLVSHVNKSQTIFRFASFDVFYAAVRFRATINSIHCRTVRPSVVYRFLRTKCESFCCCCVGVSALPLLSDAMHKRRRRWPKGADAIVRRRRFDVRHWTSVQLIDSWYWLQPRPSPIRPLSGWAVSTASSWRACRPTDRPTDGDRLRRRQRLPVVYRRHKNDDDDDAFILLLSATK